MRLPKSTPHLENPHEVLQNPDRVGAGCRLDRPGIRRDRHHLQHHRQRTVPGRQSRGRHDREHLRQGPRHHLPGLPAQQQVRARRFAGPELGACRRHQLGRFQNRDQPDFGQVGGLFDLQQFDPGYRRYRFDRYVDDHQQDRQRHAGNHEYQSPERHEAPNGHQQRDGFHLQDQHAGRSGGRRQRLEPYHGYC